MLPRGSTAPSFTLPGTRPDRDASGVSTHSLSEMLREGPAVLNFYLFDFHPECTEHMCSLHDLVWFDLDEGTTAVGISTDRSFSHRAFADTEDLSFPLLSDSDGSVAESYDVLYEEFKRHKRIAKRSVFVVDTDRTIRYAWSTDDPTGQPDFSAVKTALDASRSVRADD